jgi:tetratricopeptide (TPR) repeat protein
MSATDASQDFSTASGVAFGRHIQSATKCIQHAELLWGRGHRDPSVQCLIAGLMRHPDSVKLSCHAAFRMSVSGRHAEAEALLLSRLGAVSDEKILTALLNVYRRAEKMEETVATARKVMEVSKGDPHSPHTVVNALLQACQHDEAIAMAEFGLRRNPEDAKLKRALADAYLGAGRTGAFTELHNAMPNGIDKTYLHAKYLWLMKHTDAAKSVLIESLGQDFDERTSILMVAIIGEDMRNPLVARIHKKFHSVENDQRFEDLFKGAARMREARNAVLTYEMQGPSSPVLQGTYTSAGAVNRAALRDAGAKI